MFTSPSPQPSPRLGGERELFPFGAGVKLRPEAPAGNKRAFRNHVLMA
jgi:hypothetical protein